MSVKIVEKKIYKKGKHTQTNIYFDYYIGKDPQDPSSKVQRRRVKTDFFYITGKSKAVEKINKDTELKAWNALRLANETLGNSQSVIKATQKERKTTLLNFIQSIIKSKGKQTLYNNLYSNLQEYLTEIGQEGISFNDIDYNFLNNWSNHLINDCLLSNNSARAYYSRLNSTCTKAVLEGYTKSNPVKFKMSDFGIKPQKKLYDFLTMHEIAFIKDMDLKGRLHLTEIRNAFVFACVTGLRCDDVFNLQWSEINNDRLSRIDGKTDKPNYLKLHPFALQILTRQTDKLNITGKVFNKLTSPKNMTKQLKSLLEPMKLNKKITFHSARRSFSTMLYSNGVDLKTIQDLLNHSDIKTTMLYVGMLDVKKDTAIDMISDIAGMI